MKAQQAQAEEVEVVVAAAAAEDVSMVRMRKT